MDLQNILKETIKVSKEVGRQIKTEKEKFNYSDIEKKGLNDYVSYVDKNAETFIVCRLKTILPDAGFIVEEHSVEYKGEKYKWIIDPLDGTTNFIHGFYPFAVSIALAKEDEIILGVVYEIGQDECFYAGKGLGSFLNGKKINVSDKKDILDAMIGTGFPYSNFDKLDNYIELLKDLTKTTQGVRRLGSAAVDICYAACGRFDAFYEYDLKAWDVAAGIIIAKEAGAKISDFKGGQNYLFGKEFLVANPYIFDDISKKIYHYIK
jgi:myo-inositol-1(or 4)-monophosphatase